MDRFTGASGPLALLCLVALFTLALVFLFALAFTLALLALVLFGVLLPLALLFPDLLPLDVGRVPLARRQRLAEAVVPRVDLTRRQRLVDATTPPKTSQISGSSDVSCRALSAPLLPQNDSG